MMNETIISNWNNTVGLDDTVFTWVISVWAVQLNGLKFLID